MIKINYKEPEQTESREDVAQYNIKICDQYKKADYLELSCIAWLKIDPIRDYQDLEKLLRFMNLNSYVIAQSVQLIPIGLEISRPNKLETNETNLQIDNKLEYVARIICMSKEDSLKELLKHHTTYEENFECLKKTGCFTSIKQKTTHEETEKISQTKGIDEIKKILNCELKLDLEYYQPMDSINYIVEDLTQKYSKEPEKIICGEIGTNKVWALMMDGQIISPIGWMEKNTKEIINDMNKQIEYELIDFRKIKLK